MGVLFFAERYDLYLHTYIMLPIQIPCTEQMFYAEVPSCPAALRSQLGKGLGLHHPSGASSFIRGSPRGGEGGHAEGRQHPPRRPRCAPHGGRGTGRAGCAPRGANSRLRAANGEGRPRWHQISCSQSAREGEGEKKNRGKKKKRGKKGRQAS